MVGQHKYVWEAHGQKQLYQEPRYIYFIIITIWSIQLKITYVADEHIKL